MILRSRGQPADAGQLNIDHIVERGIAAVQPFHRGTHLAHQATDDRRPGLRIRREHHRFDERIKQLGGNDDLGINSSLQA